MKKQAGFTLIELAIVLVIIGLLLGGVLRGQELINSAKVKNLASDFRNIPVYVYGYQDKYRSLPGDDKAADSHVGVTAAQVGDGNGTIEGNWNSSTATEESALFWLHVRKAGFAPGSIDMTDSAFYPTNADGGRLGISSTSPITNLKGQYYMCSAGINGKFAKQLDLTMDDGKQGSGSMQGADQGGGTPSTDYDDSHAYTICMAF
ncbi:MAG: prepilin-type N-terminal cleavage/methylation domain-containing protein [Methylophilus sp.]